MTNSLKEHMNLVAELFETLTFRTECHGAHHGQIDATLFALRDGERVGYIDYSEFDGQPNIKMIKTAENSTRQGIASALIRELQSQYPDQEINWGGLTADGAKFYDALPKTIVVNHDVVEKQRRLSELKARLEDYSARWDEFTSKPRTDAERVQLLASTNDWNDLHDKVEQLEDELRHQSASRTIIR